MSPFSNPKTGVYCITHIDSGKRYIGSAKIIQRRFLDHKENLRKGTHKNKKLQNAWNKYGEGSFLFHILDYCEDLDELVACEQQWMDSLHPFYNINTKASSSIGVVRSEETRKKISNAKRGLTLSPEHKAKISAGGRGRVQSEGTRSKISAKMMGNQRTKGQKRSDTTKQKMSETKKLWWAKRKGET